jgi:hypothetical protein
MKDKSVSVDLRTLWDRAEGGVRIYISEIICLVHAYFRANLSTNLLSDYFCDFNCVQSTVIIISETYGCVIFFACQSGNTQVLNHGSATATGGTDALVSLPTAAPATSSTTTTLPTAPIALNGCRVGMVVRTGCYGCSRRRGWRRSNAQRQQSSVIFLIFSPNYYFLHLSYL